MTDDLVKELQQIIKEDHGKELTEEEARTFGTDLVRYFELLIEIYNENKEAINKKDEEKTDES